MADLEILRDDPGGTVTFHGNLEDDETYLYWYKINDLITHKLSGTWIHESKYTKAHWRIPNLPIRTKDPEVKKYQVSHTFTRRLENKC